MACTMCGSSGGRVLHDGGCGICGAGRFYNDAAEQIDAAVEAYRARFKAAIEKERELVDDPQNYTANAMPDSLLRVVEGEL